MPKAELPEIGATDLAERLDAGEPVQVLDIRAPEQVEAGRVAIGAALEFHALPASELYGTEDFEQLPLERTEPVAVMCGHGNSSKHATQFLRERGFAAFSVTGGMAAWEAVYLARHLTPTPSLEHVVQLDRIGKGALSYVLVSDGDALLVDPGRHLGRYEAVCRSLGATPVAVFDTHLHADYLSGARAAAARWGVAYFLHPADARSPYDDTPGRLPHEPLRAGDTVAFGRSAVRVEPVPGHTLGSVALRTEDGIALTGDFLFVQSVGRPDLGGQRDAWARLLWQSLERVRREWPGDLLVLPAHYAGERERRADRSVGARFDVIKATNEAAAVSRESAFLAWVAQHTTTPPESYRSIKLANLGLIELGERDAEQLESGPNQCALA